MQPVKFDACFSPPDIEVDRRACVCVCSIQSAVLLPTFWGSCREREGERETNKDHSIVAVRRFDRQIDGLNVA